MGIPRWYFSWAGGVIPASLSPSISSSMLVVTADTHGGIVETKTFTANTVAGDFFLDPLSVSTSDLTEGLIYGLSGPGIVPGTLLVYTPASGSDPATYAMSAPATANAGSATLVVKKPITVATTYGDVASGTISSIGDTAALVPGSIYGVSGPGIPIGTVITYGGVGLETLVDFGGGTVTTPNETSVALTFTSLPSAASSLVTNVSDITGLTIGATYDVSGPGIPKGSTFVADGTGTITLPDPAIASGLGVSLAISGPRVPTEPFDPVTHAVDDEEVLSVKITHKEGNFATLDVEIRNPGTGLLRPGRKEWAWLSYDPGDGTINPVFNGRLVGSAADLQNEVIALQFIAQPDNYAAAKAAIADSLKDLPYYDPAWLADGGDTADAVLETRSMLWHTDRVSLEVTTSDILVGEGSTWTFDEGVTDHCHFYDSLGVTVAQPPITRVSVTGTVSWTQQGSGSIDLTDRTCKLFGDAKSLWGGVSGSTHTIATLTGDGLKGAWPKKGTLIGGGWSVGLDTDITTADWLKVYGATTTINSVETTYFSPDIAQWTVDFPIGGFKIALVLNWDAGRKRTETVSFTMVSDLQRLLSQPAGADEETITLTSKDIGDAIDLDYTPPIADLRRNAYFTLDRGRASVEYLLLLARAKIRARARAVEIKFRTALVNALTLSCRDNAHIIDRRLPGGEASGKIISYELCQDSNGTPYAEITIGCSIGRGGSVTSESGIGDFVEADVLADGVGLTTGGTTSLIDGELVYQPLTDFVAKDDGLDLFDVTGDSAINSYTLTGGLKEQLKVVYSGGDPVAALKKLPTRLCLDLKPVKDVEFHTDYRPSIKPLPVPKTIDLEAA